MRWTPGLYMGASRDRTLKLRVYLIEGCVKHIPEKKAMIVPKERTAVITPIIIPHIISYVTPFKKFEPQTLNPKPLALYNPLPVARVILQHPRPTSEKPNNSTQTLESKAGLGLSVWGHIVDCILQGTVSYRAY